MSKKIVSFAIMFLLVSVSFASSLTVDDVVKNMQSNQSKIKDMYSEMTTTITSNLAMPNSANKGPQTMIQKSRMWTKGTDKSKIEVLSPTKQTTITNGNIMTMIDPQSGQKVTQDMSNLPAGKAGIKGQAGMAGSNSMNLAKALEMFDMTVSQKEALYIMEAKPKKTNPVIGKMSFFIDPTRWLPIKIIIYTPQGKDLSRAQSREMSVTEMQYSEINGVWVATKTTSAVKTPMGNMSTEMVMENVKVNGGIGDGEFNE